MEVSPVNEGTEVSLPADCDVLVVGGGIIGLACAHYLERHGRRPVVVDRGEIGRGSSYGNAGLIAPSHSIPLPAPGVVRQGLRWLLNPESPFYIRPRLDPALAHWLLRFARAARRGPMVRGIPILRDLNRLSAALYAELSREASEPAMAFHTGGVVNVYRSERAFEYGKREAELLERHGVLSEVLEGDELTNAEPALRHGLAGGVLWREDGYIDPAAFVAAWRTELTTRAVGFVTGTEVLGIDDTGSVVTARTTAGSVRCEDVVVAAGAWSAAILRKLGHHVAVQPAKGYSFTIRRPVSRPCRPLLLTEAKVAVTPMGDTLRIAGTMELAGLDESFDVRRMDALQRSVEPYLHVRSGGEAETAWRGLRSLSADGLPMIGRIATSPRIAVATGHGHLGVSLAPATGKLIAQLMSGEQPSLDLTRLRPDR
jgi:D-amino-acid dehydrogenase